MKPGVPGPVMEEYRDLYEKLNDIARVRGQIGEAALSAFKLLERHYRKDHEFALPPLKYLPALAEKNVTAEIDRIQTMTGKLRRELPHLLEENDQIARALQHVADVAALEQKPEYRDLARRFISFLEMERMIFYPASILVGEYLRMKNNFEGHRALEQRA